MKQNTYNYRYFQVKTKQKKTKEVRAIVGIIVGLILFYCLVMPDKCGAVGKFLSEKILFPFFGKTSYILALSIVLISVLFLISKKINFLKVTFGILSIAFLSAFLSVVKSDGGVFGNFFADFFIRLFGKFGSGVILIVSILYFTSALLNISLVEVFKKILNYIIQDIKEWQNARKLIKKTESKQEKKFELPRTEPQFEHISKKTEQVQQIIKKPVAEQFEEKVEKSEKIKEPEKPYSLPSFDLLTDAPQLDKEYKYEDLIQKAAILEQTLSNFNVFAKVTDIVPGPMVTRFDLTPEPGVKVQQITNLSNDIALAMKAQSVRIMAPVPGKGTVGVEIPNPKGKLVGIKEIISSKEFQSSDSKLTIALGKTTDGKPYITDLTPMPHLLIAGATGSGKSVCIHTIITSILFKAAPTEVKFLLIDPKRLELPVYNGLPHLYDPTVSPEKVQVITNPKHSARALKALVKVMEKRYEKFAKVSVRNIEGYNEYAEKSKLQKEFYIVVIIDELADLMLILPKDIEDSIQRLAQMARAVGIHLVLATQRPSVDVITGVIKANLSSRIAFQVLSKTDSRVILDITGAEDLLGKGDMLFLPTGAPKPERLQGSYVSEKDIESVVNFIKKQGLKPSYDEFYQSSTEEKTESEDESAKKYIEQALHLILERKRVSQDLLKAHFGSSSRATDILSLLEVKGFIFKPEGTNRWQIHFDKIEEYLKQKGDKIETEA